MNFFSNNRVLFWILMFLVLVNISVLAGYFIIFRNPVNPSVSTSRPGWALKKELSLTAEQTVKVQAINAAYKAAADPLIQNIQETKAGLLNELSRESTDTSVVSDLSNQISIAQKKLQSVNINQFLDLKKVCSPEQTKKLAQIYAEMYGFGNSENGKGRGKGNGMGHRHRWGQQNQGTDTISGKK